MNVEHILETLRDALDLPDMTWQRAPIDETIVALPPDKVRPAVQTLLAQFRVTHLSTITGQDTGQAIELLYHFWDRQGLTLRTALDRGAPRIATLTDLISGASFYEREAAEMLGVTFEGRPAAGPFLLPDDWDGPRPLRRSTDDE